MFVKHIPALVLLLSMAGPLKAQHKVLMEFGLLGDWPQGEFAQNQTFPGLGMQGQILFRIHPALPILKMGPRIGYSWYGSKYQETSRTFPVYNGDFLVGELQADVGLRTRSTAMDYQWNLRLEAENTAFTPYVQVGFGFRTFQTRTKITDETDEPVFSDPENRELKVITHNRDWIGTLSAGLGFRFKVANQIYVNFSTDYFYGGRIDFYNTSQNSQWQVQFTGNNWDPNNINSEDIEITGNPIRSDSNLLRFNLGICIGIN